MSDVTLGEALNLENLGIGAAREKFEDALHEVLQNILNPNTAAKAVRKVTLVVTIKPSEDRRDANLLIDCQPKLAPLKAFPTKIFIGKNIQGKPEAHEINANQFELFPRTKENVTSMTATAGKEE
jgi:hypothetical protein